MKTRTITLKLTLPRWARYVAQDRNGEWSVYDGKPAADKSKGLWCANGGTYVCWFLGLGIRNRNWRKTLRKL